MSLELKYFVLKPRAKTHDDPFAKASQKALIVYADQIEETDSTLSLHLRAWAERESYLQHRKK